jgi:hypothetical protein
MLHTRNQSTGGGGGLLVQLQPCWVLVGAVVKGVAPLATTRVTKPVIVKFLTAFGGLTACCSRVR